MLFFAIREYSYFINERGIINLNVRNLAMNKYFSAIRIMGINLGILALTIFLLSGCSQTKVTSVWVDQEYQGDGIDDVFVVGVTRDGGLRRTFEDEFVTLFMQRGVKATSSYRLLPDKDLQDEKNLDSKVRESGSDTILMTRLIDIRKDTQYIPPDYAYARPSQYYGGWHGYYNRAYMVNPGYTIEFETAVLETNLYDLKSDKLIWSARSDAPADGNVGRHIKDFAKSIINQLAEAKLIK
jgi:hypothetical protein